MGIRTSISLFALALATASVSAAPASFAQTPPAPAQADHEHGAQHPDGKAEAKPGCMGMMGQGGMMGGGMMGGDMKSMMSMMRDMMAMMSTQSGMMASYAEGRIAALKTELKITDAQMPAWNRFADALRGVAKSMNGMHEQMMMQGGKATTLPEAVARQKTMMGAHFEALKALDEALQPLYASLSPEQKKVADAIRIGPMGMM